MTHWEGGGGEVERGRERGREGGKEGETEKERERVTSNN